MREYTGNGAFTVKGMDPCFLNRKFIGWLEGIKAEPDVSVVSFRFDGNDFEKKENSK